MGVNPLITRRAWLTLAGAALLLAGLFALPADVAFRLTDEDGPIELVTAVMLALTAALCVRQWLRAPGRPLGWLSGAVVLVACALRELDFHKRFTPRAISSTRFYISDAAPLSTRLLAAVIVLCVFAALGHLLWLAWRHRERAPWLGYGLLAGLIVTLSRLAEKTHIREFYLIEEVFELTFAVLSLWLVCSLRALSRTPQSFPDSRPPTTPSAGNRRDAH